MAAAGQRKPRAKVILAMHELHEVSYRVSWAVLTCLKGAEMRLQAPSRPSAESTLCLSCPGGPSPAPILRGQHPTDFFLALEQALPILLHPCNTAHLFKSRLCQPLAEPDLQRLGALFAKARPKAVQSAALTCNDTMM